MHDEAAAEIAPNLMTERAPNPDGIELPMRLLLGLAALLAVANAYVPAGPLAVRMPSTALRTATPIAAARPVARRAPVKRAVKLISAVNAFSMGGGIRGSIRDSQLRHNRRIISD